MSTLGSAITASASALNAERQRIEVAVSNLANAESTRGPDGQLYLLTDDADGALLRLRPAAAGPLAAGAAAGTT